MKSYSLSLALIAVTSLSIHPAFAMERDGGPRFNRDSNIKSEPEIVKWVGEVRDELSSHTTDHEHDLKFIKQDTGDDYDIVDSPELVKLHHETEKNYLMEIEAEKTPRFLFWGGNLVVKNFRVVKELGGPIAHRAPAQMVVRSRTSERR